MPVGFKNGTDGNTQIAIDAIQAAGNPHHFLSVTKQGLAAIVATRGNPDCHLILRGAAGAPNYDAEAVALAVASLEKAKLRPRLMVDCSHGNSRKDPERQPAVARDLAAQIRVDGRALGGVMIESHLVGGRQDPKPGQPLTYGQSITDACLAWNDTVPVLRELADAVRARRARQVAKNCVSIPAWFDGPRGSRWTSGRSTCRRGDWPRRTETWCGSRHRPGGAGGAPADSQRDSGGDGGRGRSGHRAAPGPGALVADHRRRQDHRGPGRRRITGAPPRAEIF